VTRKRRRFGDRHKASGKPVFQPRASEGPKDRHARRLEFNLQAQDKVKVWCEDHGVALQIKNVGHHWIFTREKAKVEWWPSSAKMVINQKWNNGIHVIDYTQALEELAKVFPPLPKPATQPEPTPVEQVTEPAVTKSRWPWWIRWIWGC